MPTYDYVCDACNHEFELYQSITAAAEKKCPACGKKKLRRLIGPGEVSFQGVGLLPDRLPQRILQEGRRRRENQRRHGRCR